MTQEEHRQLIEDVLGKQVLERIKKPTTERDYKIVPSSHHQAMTAAWLIHAPWAHPAWDTYMIMVTDLTTPMKTEAKLKRDDVTHEMIVFAMNPEKEIPHLDELFATGEAMSYTLSPANHGYQFTAASDEAANNRIQGLVDNIVERTLSPDTDFRAMWDRIFSDGVSLRVSS